MGAGVISKRARIIPPLVNTTFSKRAFQYLGSPYSTWDRIYYLFVLLCITAGTTVMFAYSFESKIEVWSCFLFPLQKAS